MGASGPSRKESESERACGTIWDSKSAITCPEGVVEQVMITHKPPHYMPEFSGELVFEISGNDYLFHYLSETLGNLIYNSFGAHSICEGAVSCKVIPLRLIW